MPSRLNGFSLAYTALGGVVLWSGIKGSTLTATFRGLLSGQAPERSSSEVIASADTASATAVTASTTASTTAAYTTESAIANDALTYQGHAYLYGGAPGPAGTNPWDCSSFCNWVLGHDFNMTLPGDSSPGYNGESHGPDTLLYLAWGSATTISNSASSAEAGDLCVWQTHMGIATGGGNMVSALDESLGTRVTTIADGAPGGEVLFVRRIG